MTELIRFDGSLNELMVRPLSARAGKGRTRNIARAHGLRNQDAEASI
jgi:hypothetical protein